MHCAVVLEVQAPVVRLGATQRQLLAQNLVRRDPACAVALVVLFRERERETERQKERERERERERETKKGEKRK